MHTAEVPIAPIGRSDHLTVRFTTNPDGWVTAQLEEIPAAISQGRDEDEAWVNVLEALHDLTHQPTAAERVAYTVQARLVEPLLRLLRR
jgi:hypothetical protein